MLSPDDRALLGDVLAPPPGTTLRHAVATTFTLHLTALLPIPLGFAGLDLTASADPLGVLQAVRTYADRIDVFCQAGMVSVPSERNDLLTFLEPIVHQVEAPSPGRLFHPKLWLLRFGSDSGPDQFRLICGSRNLTHDKAWDMVMGLDGVRTGRRRAVNNPLCELLASLPNRLPVPLSRERQAAIDSTVEALHYVEWEPPDGVMAHKDWLTFHVFGKGKRPRPDFGGRRRLVVSPFMNDAGLERVWPDGDCTVVSRAESFDALHEEARSWFDGGDQPLWVLDDTAALPDIDSEEAGARWGLSGLHAKFYVVERDNRAHVFIGSANATDAGFGGNDEILVELVGQAKVFGVAATIGDESSSSKTESGFGRILKPHLLGPQLTPDPTDDLRRRLERALCDLAAIPFEATVDLLDTDEEPCAPGLTLTSKHQLPLPPDGAELSLRLLTMAGATYVPPAGAPVSHRWALGAVEDITPFVVMTLTVGPVSASCVTLALLVNDPPDRFDRVLARRLSTTEEFLRFLLLLLSLAGGESALPNESLGIGAFGARFGEGGGAGLLESLVNALATHPEAIDDIEALIAQLRATERGTRDPPSWVDDLWSSLVEARAILGRPR